MAPRTRGAATLIALSALMISTAPTYGDEGMWLFNAPPLKLLKEKYGFEPTQTWLDHVQKSSVRFNSGGSGSFVSADGLVMTNHHVGADDLAKLSTEKVNYLQTGFHAKTRDQEIKCKALELNVLMSIKDVTAEIEATLKPGMKADESKKARDAKIADLESAVADDAKGIRADVVELFAGGKYHLYTFKKYTDIRLVFAPEKQIAFYGGDSDNFEYPRYDLDMCFFRVYENGQAVKPEHYLAWSSAGAKEDDLIFVSGHPGKTDRQNTIAELEYLRDHQFPAILGRLNRLEVLLGSWAERSEANRQKAEKDLFSIQNSRKARIGGLQGLLDPKIMARKKAEEDRLMKFATETKSPVAAEAQKAFATIAAAQKRAVELDKEAPVATTFGSSLFGIARTLVRYTAEKGKPSAERLPEFAEARLPSLKFRLSSDAPIYDDYEILRLTDGFTVLATTLGGNHPMVQQVLAGKSPRDRAFELVAGTKIKDPAVRKKIFETGELPDGDPLLLLAKATDEAARTFRTKAEAEAEPVTQAHTALARARFDLDGANTYPDATFTLRLAFGTVKGYQEDGKAVPAFTTFDGLYERSAAQKNRPPFDLPPKWEQKKGSIDPKTPFNFVSTADIIGGNSGSPVVNKAGEVVGLIFDGNIQSLVLDFAYEHEVARAVSVDSRAIIESLRKVYDAADLADEIQGKKK